MSEKDGGVKSTCRDEGREPGRPGKVRCSEANPRGGRKRNGRLQRRRKGEQANTGDEGEPAGGEAEGNSDKATATATATVSGEKGKERGEEKKKKDNKGVQGDVP